MPFIFSEIKLFFKSLDKFPEEFFSSFFAVAFFFLNYYTHKKGKNDTQFECRFFREHFPIKLSLGTHLHFVRIQYRCIVRIQTLR